MYECLITKHQEQKGNYLSVTIILLQIHLDPNFLFKAMHQVKSLFATVTLAI